MAKERNLAAWRNSCAGVQAAAERRMRLGAVRSVRSPSMPACISVMTVSACASLSSYKYGKSISTISYLKLSTRAWTALWQRVRTVGEQSSNQGLKIPRSLLLGEVRGVSSGEGVGKPLEEGCSGSGVDMIRCASATSSIVAAMGPATPFYETYVSKEPQ